VREPVPFFMKAYIELIVGMDIMINVLLAIYRIVLRIVVLD